MAEICVVQQSPEWFSLRRNIPLTASQFADAAALGIGKPLDFLKSLLDVNKDPSNPDYLKHGIDLEPCIDEAYQLLTGNTTRKCGLWIPETDNEMHGLIAASPDRIVVTNTTQKATENQSDKIIGLCEYKAPIYSLYDPCKHPFGIPSKYMAQIQGQMAVTGAKWCDFMAVCTATKDIQLQRVYFCPTYWNSLAEKLKVFINVLQICKERNIDSTKVSNFPGANILLNQSNQKLPLIGEDNIIVENHLEKNQFGKFRYKGRYWVHYDVLLGNFVDSCDLLEANSKEITLLDRKIRMVKG